jgi:hypothetical protein
MERGGRRGTVPVPSSAAAPLLLLARLSLLATAVALPACTNRMMVPGPVGAPAPGEPTGTQEDGGTPDGTTFDEARAIVGGTALAVIDLANPAAPVVRPVSQHAGTAEALRLLDDAFLVLGGQEGPDGTQPGVFAALYEFRQGRAVPRGRATSAFEGHHRLITQSDGTPLLFLSPDGRRLAFSFEAFRDNASVREAQLQVFAVDRQGARIDPVQALIDGDDVTAVLPLADGRWLGTGPRLMVIDARPPPGQRPPVRPAATDLERNIFDIALDGTYAYELGWPRSAPGSTSTTGGRPETGYVGGARSPCRSS